MSRFAAELPPVDDFVELGAGDTPLLELTTLARQLGIERLSAKMESQNPTGSYKDRVAAMSMSLALDRGNPGWIATSSGNAGLAMAAYGVRARLPGFLCLVASAPPEKRLPLAPYGIGVVAVDGVGRQSKSNSDKDLLEQVRAAADRFDLYLGVTAHAYNPDGMRGIDTLAYELAEQAPTMSHVYVPTGGGGLLTAIARGLARRTMPTKVIACQPTGCAPIVEFLRQEIPEPQVPACHCDISALQIPQPPDGIVAALAVKSSDGWGTAADDDAILAAQQLLAETEGIFVEPASAASLASLVRDIAEDRVGAGDHPVLVLSGAGWKDLGRMAERADKFPLVELKRVSEEIEGWFGTLRQRASR
ncbi:pyridoxal-phosphate dependent enzyme [Amycolatopsis acidicola]|nr:pyridoxal-phosphate dependent enzyme [Amycolatopsis acidicola]